MMNFLNVCRLNIAIFVLHIIYFAYKKEIADPYLFVPLKILSIKVLSIRITKKVKNKSIILYLSFNVIL